MSAGIAMPSTIVCVDCGGVCHLLAHPEPDDGWQPGDIAAYRCEDCLDRWDLVVEAPGGEEPDGDE